MDSRAIAQWRAKQETFYQRCKPIFDQAQPELIKTHYNWYMAVEPESGEYFVEKDEMAAIKLLPFKILLGVGLTNFYINV